MTGAVTKTEQKLRKDGSGVSAGAIERGIGSSDKQGASMGFGCSIDRR